MVSVALWLQLYGGKYASDIAICARNLQNAPTLLAFLALSPPGLLIRAPSIRDGTRQGLKLAAGINPVVEVLGGKTAAEAAASAYWGKEQ